MRNGEDGLRLRIFIHESLRHEHEPLYAHLVQLARREGLAGATVFRGMEGYGRHRHVHTSRLVEASDDLPVIVEIVDRPEVVRRFAATVRGLIGHGTATIAPVRILKYGAGAGS